MIFVMNPALANRLAAVASVGCGADLCFYVTIPGLAFALMLLLSHVRELERRSTCVGPGTRFAAPGAHQIERFRGRR